jgi:hypothetical protein
VTASFDLYKARSTMSQPRRVAHAILSLFLTLGAACSSGSTTGEAAGGQATTDGGARAETGTAPTTDGGGLAPAEDAGASCNTLTQMSSGVDAQGAGGPLYTSPAGGTIADGVYVLTGFKVYAQSIPAGPIAGDKIRGITLEVRGSTVQFVIEGDGGEERATATMSLGTNSFLFTYSCNLVPAGGGRSAPSNGGYTATPNALVLFDTNAGVSQESTFSKR